MTVPKSPIEVSGASWTGAGYTAYHPATGRTETGLMLDGELGRWQVAGTSAYPTIADTLAVGANAARYQALLIPVRDWVRAAEQATKDVADALVPGTGAIAEWLAGTGYQDPVTYLTAIVTMAGALEDLTRPAVQGLSVAPSNLNPDVVTGVAIEAEALLADSWVVKVTRESDGAIAWTSATGSGSAVAATWEPQAAGTDPDGFYRVEVVATRDTTDSHPVYASVRLDREAPEVTITSPSGGTYDNTSVAFVTVSGSVTDAQLASYTTEVLRPSASEWEVLKTGSSQVIDGALGLLLLSEWPLGSYQVRVRSSDKAGNQATPATASFTITGVEPDLEAPGVSFVSLPASPWQGRQTIDIQATDASGIARVELWLDGTRIGIDEPGGGPTSYDADFDLNTWTLANGSHTLLARAVDLAGREASVSETVTTTNAISELKAEPWVLDQVNETTLITGRLSAVAGWTASLLDDAEEATGLSKTGDGTLLTVHWLRRPDRVEPRRRSLSRPRELERRDGRRRSGLRQQQPAARGDARDPGRRRGGGEPALDPRQRG